MRKLWLWVAWPSNLPKLTQLGSSGARPFFLVPECSGALSMMPSNRHGQVWSCGETVKTPFPQRQKWTKITLFCGVGSCPREMGFHYYLSTRSAEIEWAGCQPSGMTYSWEEAQRSTSEVTSDCLKHCTTGPQLYNLGTGGSNSVQSKICIYL